MLDGLLGRGGFTSKCKSLIKITRTRIDVTRRKRYATQKFLKQDIADLIADGLESNAFGRADGLIAELCLTSCYDFIDHVCEIILKHLSTMQKQGECPEDCREAVASLMFSAARFSDLPELRNLRNIFQERYGNSLEYYVNQKLVEHIVPKPPDMEKKLKLLQDIASEFSVNWDSFAFQQRMINSAAAREDKPAASAYIHSAKENKHLVPQPNEIVHKIDNDPIAKRGFEASHQMKGRGVLKNEHQPRPGAAVVVQRQRTDKPFHEQELNHNKHKPPIGPKAVQKTEDENVISRWTALIVDAQNSVGHENGHSGRSGTVGSSLAGRAEPFLSEHKTSFNGRPLIGPKAAQKTEDEDVISRWRALMIDAENSAGHENGHLRRSDTVCSSLAERAEPVLSQHKTSFDGRQKNVPEIEHIGTASLGKVETMPAMGEERSESACHFKHNQENGHLGRSGTAGSSRAERAEPVLSQHKTSSNGRHKTVPEIEHHRMKASQKVEALSAKGEECNESAGHLKHGQDFVSSPIQKLPGESTDKLKCKLRSNMLPPYVKPHKSKHKSGHPESCGPRGNGEDNDTLTFNPGAENLEPVVADIPHYTAVYYKDDTSGTDITPRRRSRRRRHKSSSIPSDGSENVEEVRVVRRIPTSRRRNVSKKGLQILSENDHPHRDHHHQRDTEERVMDKLLLHYSKKPMAMGAAGEPSERPRGKAKNRIANAGEPIWDEAEMNEDLVAKPTSRSISLPREQSSSEFTKKVFTRAVSFDQEASTPVKHVHPKLPDYDDLAARFAAMRRNKA